VILGVLMQALADASPSVRSHAANALGMIGPMAQPAGAALVVRLQDDDAWVRLNAAEALYCVRRDVLFSLDALVALLDDDMPAIRMAAAWGLWQMGGDAYRALPFLQKDRLANDPDAAVRYQVMETIERIQAASADLSDESMPTASFNRGSRQH
jgi:HEAT repeat protein